MCINIQVLTLEHCWNISTASFDHPPYRPDLTSSNYHVFTYLKNWLQSQCFSNNKELLESVRTWLSSQAADFFGTGIKVKFSPLQALEALRVVRG
jgi:hypothetical protein